jgi:hypothetical protein
MAMAGMTIHSMSLIGLPMFGKCLIQAIVPVYIVLLSLDQQCLVLSDMLARFVRLFAGSGEAFGQPSTKLLGLVGGAANFGVDGIFGENPSATIDPQALGAIL